jgi:hypothetical protein
MLVVGTLRAGAQGLPLGDALREALVFAIALAVGAIPEGLPAIVTIALAIGVARRVRHDAARSPGRRLLGRGGRGRAAGGGSDEAAGRAGRASWRRARAQDAPRRRRNAQYIKMVYALRANVSFV